MKGYPSVRLRLPPPLNRAGAREYPIANDEGKNKKKKRL
jgi:hypothetical protein